ncbi:hypothetical protein RchiOBHm_Chr3g0459341 [Rosa chinensis]|uniref:DUF7866 domain-containing protein n=1 Tax=Rosa chinensis TaxID=74649 RepID=A0A2P6R828_ROSCH|nr:uncharacterized protein LOC112193530 [Rosa chinensis]PRQ42593.1 hypothetical protein RchiOBHm_Chr3g0459341 [Rosa chinensis]
MNDYDFMIRSTIKSVVAIVLFMALLTMSSSTTTSAVSHDVLEFIPMKNSMEFQVLDVVRAHDEARRRRLEPYQLCLVCKCCAGTTCSTMPCCFGIDCQLPGKPFGVCAFVPKICNCTNCTSSSSTP